MVAFRPRAVCPTTRTVKARDRIVRPSDSTNTCEIIRCRRLRRRDQRRSSGSGRRRRAAHGHRRLRVRGSRRRPAACGGRQVRGPHRDGGRLGQDASRERTGLHDHDGAVGSVHVVQGQHGYALQLPRWDGPDQPEDRTGRRRSGHRILCVHEGLRGPRRRRWFVGQRRHGCHPTEVLLPESASSGRC